MESIERPYRDLVDAARQGDLTFALDWIAQKKPVNPPARQSKNGALSALMAAACNERVEITQALLAAGADAKSATDEDGWTALMLAAEGAPECLKLLLPFSDPMAASGKFKETALMNAVATSERPGFDVIRCVEILLPVSDLRAQNSEGETPLLIAAVFAKHRALKILAPHSDLSQKDNQGKTALDWALKGLKKNPKNQEWIESADLLACLSDEKTREKALRKVAGALPRAQAMKEAKALEKETRRAKAAEKKSQSKNEAMQQKPSKRL